MMRAWVSLDAEEAVSNVSICPWDSTNEELHEYGIAVSAKATLMAVPRVDLQAPWTS